MNKALYIAAASQHVGKTTSTLGIIALLRQHGIQAGYCKPVGQRHLNLNGRNTDMDALLFSTVMDFNLQPEIHSPVVLSQGVTKKYLDSPEQFQFRDKILHASSYLRQEHELVVYEGTGHPGVGSVVNLSNAEVAKLLGASVILVVEGGIGKTIDQINLNLSLFRERKVPVIGVIVNKVFPRKIEEVQHYVGLKLKEMGIPLLGVLPFDQSLSNPIMASVCEAIQGKILLHRDQLNNKVENIISGALIENQEFEDLKDLLLIVNYKRLDNALKSIQEITQKNQIEGTPLTGIIINGNGDEDFIEEFWKNFENQAYVKQYRLPVIATSLDTYGAALKISKIEVKINTRTPWKSRRAIQLIKKHVNLQRIALSSIAAW